MITLKLSAKEALALQRFLGGLPIDQKELDRLFWKVAELRRQVHPAEQNTAPLSTAE